MEDKVNGLQEQINKITQFQEKQTEVLNKLLNFIDNDEDEVDQASTSETDIDNQEVTILKNPNSSSVSAVVNECSAPSTESKSEESLWTQRLSKYKKEEQMSTAVSPDLAEYVNQAVTNKPDTKELEQLTSKFYRPENTAFLTVPRTNIECWRLMPQSVQTKDKQVQKNQQKVVHSMTPLVHALEELNQTTPSIEKIKDAIIHSFEIMANLQMDLNIARKETIRPHLHKAAHLANKNAPITDMLFGDDVESEMKKVEVATKLHQNMKATDKSKFKRLQNFKERAKAFLGNQGGQSPHYASPGFKKGYPKHQYQQHYQHQTQQNRFHKQPHHQTPAQNQLRKKGLPSQWKNKKNH